MDPLNLNKTAATLTQGAETIAAGAEATVKESLQVAEVALADTLSVAGGEVDRLTKMIDQRAGDILAEVAELRKMLTPLLTKGFSVRVSE